MQQAMRAALGVFLALTVLFAAVSLLEYYELNSLRPQVVSTTTVTTTSTVTMTQYGSASSTIAKGTATNGSVSIALSGWGIGGGALYFDLYNAGSSPLGVRLVYVNGLAAYLNGTSSILTVSPNPIPPGKAGLVTAFYKTGPHFCGGDSAAFTIVTDQGVSVNDFGYFPGGTSTSTSSSSANHVEVKNASLAFTPRHDQLNVSAAVAVNGTIPISRLSYSVNDSCQYSVALGTGNPNQFTYQLRDAVVSIDVPIQAGKSYTIAIYAQFQDGSYAAAKVNATVTG